jgi:hypothetical protein
MSRSGTGQRRSFRSFTLFLIFALPDVVEGRKRNLILERKFQFSTCEWQTNGFQMQNRISRDSSITSAKKKKNKYRLYRLFGLITIALYITQKPVFYRIKLIISSENV